MNTERGLELLERVRAVCAPLPETSAICSKGRSEKQAREIRFACTLNAF